MLMNLPFPRKGLLIVMALGACGAGSTHGAGPNFVDLIQPILERNCLRCHNPDKAKGGLSMDSYAAMIEGGDTGAAIVPGDIAQSELLVRIHLRPIDEGVMPDEGQALTPEEVGLLDAWVDAGASWPPGLTLQERKPTSAARVAMPDKAPGSAAEAAAMLDGILHLENAGTPLITSAPIADSAFLRRATIDLIGRIPTVAEIREFEAWGQDRREQLVAKLLGDPRFADRWTVFMSDMLRIRSDIPGGKELLAFVHGSINQQKPYDVLVRELVSASGRTQSNPAVGYLLGDDVEPMELAAATAQIFMGVRIGCAMCHDHPFDDWKQKEFYQFAAFFGKTQKVQGRQEGMVYTTEGDKMTILWPPEDKAGTEARIPLSPRFPFKLADGQGASGHLDRLAKRRSAEQQAAASGQAGASLDALLDAIKPGVGTPLDPVLEEAKEQGRALDIQGDLHRTSELREQLADLITQPRNDLFAQAFVNRVWAEFMGRGFVEPLDNFSPYNLPNNPTTLEFLSREFIAGGYDLRHLVRIITLSDAYRRSALPATTPVVQREESQKRFAAAPPRRMLGEVLFDSVVIAGHLQSFKWPAGANDRQVSRQIRVPTGAMAPENPAAPTATPLDKMAAAPAPRGDGYDLESSLKLDFHAILTQQERSELESMRALSNEQIEAEKMMAMQRDSQAMAMEFTTATVVETVDDNPRFGSSMQMATPAPPAHFLRVFGQPGRSELGEFRDSSPSLRQQLMMLNGRMTHEASRVGPLEPLYRILQSDQGKAIDWAYQEILSRLPSAEEKAEAEAMLAGDALQGMADLRWVLLNSHEFRFIP
jgi:hypothetical protein